MIIYVRGYGVTLVQSLTHSFILLLCYKISVTVSYYRCIFNWCKET